MGKQYEYEMGEIVFNDMFMHSRYRVVHQRHRNLFSAEGRGREGGWMLFQTIVLVAEFRRRGVPLPFGNFLNIWGFLVQFGLQIIIALQTGILTEETNKEFSSYMVGGGWTML